FVNGLVQRMTDGAGNPIQFKMEVTAADDKYENEADATAKEVVSAISSGQVQREGEEEEVMMKRDTIQREGEEEEVMMKRDTIQRDEDDDMVAQMKRQPIQRNGDLTNGGEVGDDVEKSINSLRGGGAQMDDKTLGEMNSAFGADFSNVRVHTGAESNQLNNAVQAKAFTTGSDIFFKSGEYNPGSSGGKELLAHELTHTIQQGATQISKKEDDK
ncbi:MAG: DUF4157 domain-containing protein, partial [Chloroflexota bacterium]